MSDNDKSMSDGGAAPSTMATLTALRALLSGAGQVGSDTELILSLARASWSDLSSADRDLLWRAAEEILRHPATAEAEAFLLRIARDPDAPETLLCALMQDKARTDLGISAAQNLLARAHLTTRTRTILSGFVREQWPESEQYIVLERLHAMGPKDFRPFLNLVRHCAKAGLTDKVTQFLAMGPNFAEADHTLAQFFAALDTGAYAEACGIYIARAEAFEDAPRVAGLNLLKKCKGPGLEELRKQLTDVLRRHYPDEPDLRREAGNPLRESAERMLEAARAKDWARADQIRSGFLAYPDPKPTFVRVALVRYLLERRQVAEALAAIEPEKRDGLYAPQFVGLAMRMLCDLGSWTEVLEIGLAQLKDIETSSSLLRVLLDAARRTGRVHGVLSHLLAQPKPWTPEVTEAMAGAVEDLAAVGDGIAGAVEAIGLSPARAARVRAKSPIYARLPALGSRICICYCVDHYYAVPALVSIVSLVVNNSDLLPGAQIIVLLDSDAEPLAALFTALGDRLKATIKIMRASEIAPEAEDLDGRYGFFTAGGQLSRAAYHRIFLAKHLARSGAFDEMLYIDSDTVVRPGLHRLFDIPLKRPLMARPGIGLDRTTELEKAYGLKRRYFNSGVLRFSLQHSLTQPALATTIACVLEKPDALAFHDQCALNIGFNGTYEPLPPEFNYFAGPSHRAAETAAIDPVILHHLGFPKPWDSSYAEDASEWFSYYTLTRHLVGGELPLPTSRATPPRKADEVSPFLVFIHVPKTAGTSLKGALGEAFGAELLWFSHAANEDIDRTGIAHFSQRDGITGAMRDKWRALGGHFSLDDIPQALQVGSLITGVIREPVSRALSYYAYLQGKPQTPLGSRISGLTLRDALEMPQFASALKDRQIRLLFGRSSTVTSLGTLTGQRLLIGKYEFLDTYAAALASRCGRLIPSLASHNVSEAGYASDLSRQNGYEEAIEIIRQLTTGDMYFYHSFGEILDVNP